MRHLLSTPLLLAGLAVSVGDNLHFSTEALRELGKRYAEAYLKTQARPHQP
ncbi:MAG: hypothetical protein IAE94_13480 [Chthoniobacterales bacterium]|nr:hypothetical protein [Chthoniobacterales bacterium]